MRDLSLARLSVFAGNGSFADAVYRKDLNFLYPNRKRARMDRPQTESAGYSRRAIKNSGGWSAGMNEFYVGYLPKAPVGIARRIKVVVLFLLVFAVVAAIVFATVQR